MSYSRELGSKKTGESACASPENFDEALGRDIARRNAKDKIWSLEGYLLKQDLHEKRESMERWCEGITNE